MDALAGVERKMLGSCSTCAGWLLPAVFVDGFYLLLKNDLRREREGKSAGSSMWRKRLWRCSGSVCS